jgi:hypothetical protein
MRVTMVSMALGTTTPGRVAAETVEYGRVMATVATISSSAATVRLRQAGRRITPQAIRPSRAALVAASSRWALRPRQPPTDWAAPGPTRASNRLRRSMSRWRSMEDLASQAVARMLMRP